MSKIKNFKKELRDLAANDLEQRVEMLRRDLFSIRLQFATNPVKDTKQFSRLRKDIARAVTILGERRATKSLDSQIIDEAKHGDNYGGE